MRTLRISLIIPVYNEERYLRACLDSVAAQTVKPYEVIVLDNNSADTSAEIAGSYPFVKLLREPKQGIVFARDTGFNAARGDIIARIDGDTVLPPDWIARIADFYSGGQHADHALTGGGYFYNVRLPKLNGWLQGQLAFRTNRLLSGHYILWGSNMALPAELWRRVRNEVCQRTDIHEDMDLAIHLHRLGCQITYHEGLRVGVAMKRVEGELAKLRTHAARWPKTLRTHGIKLWWGAMLGNGFLMFFVIPFFCIAEKLAVLFGRRPLLDL